MCNAYVDRAYYKMNSEGSGIVAVENYQANPIAPCTGIMVEADAEGAVIFSKVAPELSNNNGNLEIALSQVVEPNNQSLRGGTTKQSTLDNVIVSFNEGIHLEKFYFGNGAKLYIPQGGKDYAIAFSEGKGEMPLNFKATENGEYALNVNPEGLEMAYLHLIDNLTGTDVDLLNTPSYTFTAKTSDYESRFRLVFVDNEEDASSTGSEAFAFCLNGNWIITNEGEATLQIIDVTGRILSSEEINGSASKGIDAQAGVYVLRLINGENVKTQKIIVR